MSDLISRQAAIDAVYKCTDIFVNNLPVMVDKADAYKALTELPSAEPNEQIKWERDTAIQQLADLGYGLGEKPRRDDCISRRAVIKLIREMADDFTKKFTIDMVDPRELAFKVWHLPSAEPERKKGRWLDDHGNEKKDGYGADCSVCGWWSEYLTDFCGSCGADMRGGEDETD